VIFDDDQGPNTGGMGAFAPSPLSRCDRDARILQQIVDPVLARDAREGARVSRASCTCGLMLTTDGPKRDRVQRPVRRSGGAGRHAAARREPGRRLLQDAAVRRSCAMRIFGSRARARRRVSCLRRAGYPRQRRNRTGDQRASTSRHLTRGRHGVPGGNCAEGWVARDKRGRVLTVVGRGDRYEDAIARAYDGVARITFEGRQFRRDIGRSALHPPRTLKSSHSGQ
jgi:phosphoribosylamine---glycine ligase